MLEQNPNSSPESRPLDEMPYKMSLLLRTMLEQGASDLHLAAGRPPVYRLGNLQDVEGRTFRPPLRSGWFIPC
jgi:hypothetical protein